MNRSLFLVLSAVPVVLACATGCKKTVPTVEAGTDLVPNLDDASVVPVAEVDAGPAPTLATATATTTATVAPGPKPSAKPVEGGVFQGSYTCGLTISQTGNNVGGRKGADAQNYSTVACSVAGESCDGMAQIFVAGKLSGTKKFSMKRAANGDITYKEDGAAPTLCKKK